MAEITADAPPAVSDSAPTSRSPWRWVPSLYFAEGLPYMAVMALSVILYKRMGLSNTDIALYTSWLYLPWVIKPFWSPLVDVLKTKRWWIVAMQVLIGGGLAGVALTLPTAGWIQGSLAFFWLLAFSSATHDIAADGFYLLALDEHDQAWYVGIRSTFYRAAIFAVSGAVPFLAGSLESSTGLGAVDVEVRAVEAAAPPSPGALPLEATARTAAEGAARDDLALSASAASVDVGLVPRPTAEVDTVLAAARAANVAAGFYAVEGGAGPADDAGPSWWTRRVSGPLGRAIAGLFGEDAPPPSATAGDVAVVAFRLSGPPPAGEEVAVNLGLQSGDESLHLVEGGQRFTFTDANWDRPFLAVVQADSKLDGPTEATFRATSGNIPLAWSISFFVLAGVFLALMLWHAAALPRPAADHAELAAGGAAGLAQYLAFLALFIPALAVLLVPMALAGIVAPRTTGPWGRLFRSLPFADTPFAETIVSFFEKPEIGVAVAFVLFYRFAEGQVVKLVTPFLLDSVEAGGLALTTGEVGLVYGTVGVAALTVGGILGGIVAARDGLGRWLWPMVLAINVPNAVYLALAVFRPESLWVVSGAVAVEQFGYGFGFAAFLLVLIWIAEGEHKTAHYAIGTGLMALGMMLPGFISGWLEDLVGYQSFFVWVLIATLPSFLVVARIRVDPSFGKKDAAAETTA